MFSRFACLVGQAVDEIVRNVSRGKNTRAAGCEAKKIDAAFAVDTQESIEYRRDQDCAAVVRLGCVLVIRRTRRRRHPLSLFVNTAERVAEGAVTADAVSELLGQLAQQTLLPKIA